MESAKIHKAATETVKIKANFDGMRVTHKGDGVVKLSFSRNIPRHPYRLYKACRMADFFDFTNNF